MSSIEGNIKALLKELPQDVKVVAVTKTRSPGEIMHAYRAGLRTFGENRVQELAEKRRALPGDISWHLIGHLQTNKVREAVAVAAVIESVDSLRLLEKVDAEALKQGRKIDCLLQFHIATEETKSGFAIADAESTDWASATAAFTAVRICGVMGIATFTDNEEKVRREFKSLAAIFMMLRDKYFRDNACFREISMGMTGDWRIAVDEGSTMIRVGTLIFGERLIY